MDQLRKCQRDALISFEKYFYEEERSRGIISMCCGSGKTRVIYEMIKLSHIKYNNSFFVLATSRKHLIYQIGNDLFKWSEIDNLPFNIRFVGGNGEDRANETLCEPADIRSEIQSIYVDNKEPLLIITTYHSSKKIIDAINGKIIMYPECVFFDESHNVCGENKEWFQSLIKINNPKFDANKFVFMTATPVKLSKKDESDVMYSMDNQTVFGDIVYEYSFAQGINDHIITDFKTIYYEKNQNNLINKEFINELNGKTKTEKQSIYFKTICNFLINTIKSNNLKYIIAYCANQTKAVKMMEYIQSVREFDSWVGSIISKQLKKERKQTLQMFEKKDNKPHILFTVSIFDEGVDIKCADAVFFSEERTTEARIVQNVGRCLRTFPGKTMAHVIIPNIVYEYETGNNNISKTYSSYFKKIRYVLEQMKSKQKNKYWNKYIEDHQGEDKIEIHDVIKNDEQSVEIEDALDLSGYYDEKYTYQSIANEQLSKLKKMKPTDITTIRQWNDYAKEHHIPFVRLHSDFELEWVCWGDFLLNKTYTYTESKRVIQTYFPKKFKTVGQWKNFYHRILDQEISQTRTDDINDQIITQLIHIPEKPKEYYKNSWIDWQDFLGPQLEIPELDLTCIMNPSEKQQYGLFGEANIRVLINDDYDLVKKSIKEEKWIKVSVEQEYTDKIIKYLKRRFGVEPEIGYNVLMKQNGSMDIRIMCGQTGINPSIIVFPMTKKIRYAKVSENAVNQMNETEINDLEFRRSMDKLVTYIDTKIQGLSKIMETNNDPGLLRIKKKSPNKSQKKRGRPRKSNIDILTRN